MRFRAWVFTTDVRNGLSRTCVGGAHRTHQIVVVKLLFVLSVASTERTKCSEPRRNESREFDPEKRVGSNELVSVDANRFSCRTA
jgi:hypothetical protein